MTDKYAVIGNPISHSKSPLIHAAFAKQTNQDMSYEAILAKVDGFKNKTHELIKVGFKGANVTVPFKFAAFNLCDELTMRAQLAGAVNTLTFKQGKIYGDNTDGRGLVCDISQNLNVEIQHKNLLLMGSGGAAYGVVLPLLEAGAILTVANRTPEKAVKLAATFNNLKLGKVLIKAGNIAQFKNQVFDIIVNATSTGLTDDLPEINVNNFATNCLAYDMMYSRETPFMALARAAGAQVADGLGMLVEQAAEAFYLWRNVRPQTASVITLLNNSVPKA